MTNKSVWKFEVQRNQPDEHGRAGISSTDYATGETEAEAIRDLAVKRNCESAGYDAGDAPNAPLNATGRWVLVCADGTDLHVSRGVKLA